jgi:hypothetical protein
MTSRGVLFPITSDELARLQAAANDRELMETVTELERLHEDRVPESEALLEAMQLCFDDDHLPGFAQEALGDSLLRAWYPVGLGGRQLHNDEDCKIELLMPEHVRLLAPGYDRLSEARLREHYARLQQRGEAGAANEEGEPDVWARYGAIRDLLRRAATSGSAIVSKRQGDPPLAKPTPFAREVRALVRGESTLDRCAEILRQHERKWDLEHVAPALETYVEDWTIKTRSPASFAHVVGIPEDEAVWDEFVRQRYYGFLSETHLVLGTTRFSDCYDIVFSNRYSFQATARGWGGMYSDWANRVGWLGRRDWKYVDFYGYSHLFVPGGEPWEEAVYEVVEHKTRQDHPGEFPAPK